MVDKFERFEGKGFVLAKQSITVLSDVRPWLNFARTSISKIIRMNVGRGEESRAIFLKRTSLVKIVRIPSSIAIRLLMLLSVRDKFLTCSNTVFLISRGSLTEQFFQFYTINTRNFPYDESILFSCLQLFIFPSSFLFIFLILYIPCISSLRRFIIHRSLIG